MAFRKITQEEVMNTVARGLEEHPIPESLPPFTAPEGWTKLCCRCRSVLSGRARGEVHHGDYFDILLGGYNISKSTLNLALDNFCMICTPMAAAFEKPEFADTLSSIDWEKTSILYGSPVRVPRGVSQVSQDLDVNLLRRSRPGRIWQDNCISMTVCMHTLDRKTGRWRSLFEKFYELEPAKDVYLLAERTVPSELNVSKENRRVCMYWIKTYRGDHAKCNHSLHAKAWRPKRLLHLTAGQTGFNVRLDDDEKRQISAYVTASYCWGPDPNLLKLEQNTYERFKKTIPMKDIPKTLQQILILAWNLEFEFVWIDSLCIIQDSLTEDWPEQAALMGKIYACSTLNIAATGSSYAKDSLVYSRDVKSVQPCSVFVDVPGAPTGEYAIYPLDFIHGKLGSRTINGRGWVFQERLLSPCTLHVGSDQLFWECREFIACETFPLGLPKSLTDDVHFAFDKPFLKSKLVPFLGKTQPATVRSKPSKSKQSFADTLSRLKRMSISSSSSGSTAIITNNDLESDPDRANIYLRWREAVEAYSECAFTKSKDRLWALQGIGEAAHVYLQDDLIAGMWMRTLPRDLLWRRKNVAGRQMPDDPQAPFWSWAALEGPVQFHHASRWDHFPARILSLSAPKDPKKPVDAILMLKSQIFTAVLTQNQLVVEHYRLEKQRVLFDAGEFPDTYTKGVVCIVLLLPSSYENPDGNFDVEVSGIVVVPIGARHKGASVFIRIAYFELSIGFGQIGKLCHYKELCLA